MQKLRHILNSGIFYFCSFILVIMVSDVSWQVLSRYILDEPASFTDEVARFSMIWLGLLGGAVLFGTNGHLAITILSDRCSEKYKRVWSLFIYILVIAFVCFSMLYAGINLVKRMLLQPSPALHIPMGYVYSILPISGGLILIFVALNIYDLFKNNKASSEKVGDN